MIRSTLLSSAELGVGTAQSRMVRTSDRRHTTGDARPEDARSGDARSEDAGLGDAGSGDARSEDARPEDARSGDARLEDARSGDARSEDAGLRDAGSGDVRSEDARLGDAGSGDDRLGDARLGGIDDPLKTHASTPLSTSNSPLTTDLLAQDIRQAMYHLGEITGEISTEDLLGNIFGRFCIGK